jgi:uncharacterized protein (TIGR03118 family)
VTGAAPTGQVFNADQSAFVVKDNSGHSGSSVFLFDTENGTIDGWSPGVNPNGTGPSIVTEVASNKGARAVYKGLAIATTRGKTFLYATNFHSGRVEVYNSKFKQVDMTRGRFVDRRLPAGYGPFGIREIMGKLYVTFAKQDATRHDDVAGRSHGFVDVFTNSGQFVHRLVTRGALNSPWGLALAPGGFGRFSKELLVGNFGNATSTFTTRPARKDHRESLTTPASLMARRAPTVSLGGPSSCRPGRHTVRPNWGQGGKSLSMSDWSWQTAWTSRPTGP